MLNVRLNYRNGRVIIEEDGYSDRYHAYEQGAPTYKLSMPIDEFCESLPLGDWSDLSDEEITRVANKNHFEIACYLWNLIKTRSNLIHIIRKIDRIR